MDTRHRATPYRGSPALLAACLTILIALTACNRPDPVRDLDAQSTQAALAVVIANAESTRAAALLTLAPSPTAVTAKGGTVTVELPQTATPEPSATLVPPSATPTPAPPTPTPTVATSTPEVARATSSQKANVRSGPGTAYPRTGQLTTGTTYRVTGRNEAGSWWQIDLNGKVAWVSGDMVTVQGSIAGVPVLAVVPPPAPAHRCFTPKLRHYEAHKGCCGEILGEVRDLNGRPFSAAQLEVTVPSSDYRTLWPLSGNGDYSVTALSSGNPYAVRLVGNRVQSGSFDVRYGYNLERALVDFFETKCAGDQAAEPEPDDSPVATEVVPQTDPVFRCTRRTQARTCPSATCGIAADLPAGWQSAVAACDSGCTWVRLQGCGGAGECWVLASDGEITGDLGRLRGTPGQGAGLPRYRWSTPVRVSETGQGGPNQAVVADGDGRLLAFWEEHLGAKTQNEPFYGPVHYRVWDGARWTETAGIPGSDNHGESIATALADGSILVGAVGMDNEYNWFRWKGGSWTELPEMALKVPQNASSAGGLVADGGNQVFVFTPNGRVWNGSAWKVTQDLGFVSWRGALRDSLGRAHAIAPTSTAERELVHWLWTGGNWSRQETAFRPAAGTSFNSFYSAAIAPDDTLHLTWALTNGDFMARSNGTLHDEWVSYSRRDAFGWGAPQVVAGPIQFARGGIVSTEIAMLPDGNAVIAFDYYTGNNESGIYVLWGRDGNWSEPVLFASPSGGTYNYPGVGVDRQGRIHVFWARLGEGQAVYYVMGTPE